MKTTIILFALLGFVLMNCTDASHSERLKDDRFRRMIFSEILDNHTYLREFMDSMRTSDHARMMIHADSSLADDYVHQMPAEKMLGHLMAKVDGDSTACKMMCSVMMEHKKVMGTMLETLNKGGIVDKGCMAKMKDKQDKKAGHAH